MKKILYIIVLTIVVASFGKKSEFNLVTLNSGLKVDMTEIKNIDWREYLYWISKVHGKNSSQYKEALPDTTVWRTNTPKNEPYVEFYFRHPAYAEYPIVGITFEQAVAFCQWRSNRVNELIYRKANKIKPDVKVTTNYPEIYKFRLPTKDEWLSFSNVKSSEKDIKKRKKKFPDSYRIISGQIVIGNFATTKKDSANENANITAPVHSYFPNTYGIYNTFGNVAEMTSEKGIAMGGHFNEKLEDFEIEKEYSYEKSTYWLGFRCVAEKR